MSIHKTLISNDYISGNNYIVVTRKNAFNPEILLKNTLKFPFYEIYKHKTISQYKQKIFLHGRSQNLFITTNLKPFFRGAKPLSDEWS